MSRLAAIGIATGDLAESVRFYRLLGVDVPDPDPNDHGHLDAVLPNGLRLMWDTVEVLRQIDPGWAGSGGQGVTMAFECSSPGEVDNLHGWIVDAGFRSMKEPWDAFWGQRYARVLDPDGHAVDLFAPL